jgi:hypothetical protein
MEFGWSAVIVGGKHCKKTMPSCSSHPSRILTTLLAAAAAVAVATTPLVAHAQNEPPGTSPELFKPSPKTWELVLSPYTYHWSEDPAHKHIGLVGLELHNPADHSLWGLALFPNSFGQNSAYAYYGHEFNEIFGQPRLFLKVSAGLIYGYKGEYKNKVPLNIGGFSPVIIPALGYRITPRDSVQAAVLGTAGVMFMYTRGF